MASPTGGVQFPAGRPSVSHDDVEQSGLGHNGHIGCLRAKSVGGGFAAPALRQMIDTDTRRLLIAGHRQDDIRHRGGFFTSESREGG